ncbi:MAG: hypothetical protein JO260_06890 [Acidobacteria bacterium]|nr:hypothetical protein [Acidobacteriota bacterium]
MKRLQLVLLAAVCSLCLASGATAQLGGMQFFSKPNIADIFKPVVGQGAVYQETSEGKPGHETEMTIVGKEMTPSGEGYWMEMTMNRAGDQKMYSKVLMTKDFQFTKVIFQMPGQSAMEMPMNPNEKDRAQMKEEMAKWSQVGTETITVPAGTFSCAHWKKDDGTDEVWTSDKVSPLAMVKQTSKTRSMVLVRQITNAQDHITGPVTPFDPKAFMRNRNQ